MGCPGEDLICDILSGGIHLKVILHLFRQLERKMCDLDHAIALEGCSVGKRMNGKSMIWLLVHLTIIVFPTHQQQLHPP